MIALSRECEYGIRGLLVLARQGSDRPLLLSEIARQAHVPSSFLAKTFRTFGRHGLVRSYRGARRGYTLGRPPAAIALRDVLEAVQGPGLFDRCLLRGGPCDEVNPCLLHTRWVTVRRGLRDVFQETTLAHLLAGDLEAHPMPEAS